MLPPVLGAAVAVALATGLAGQGPGPEPAVALPVVGKWLDEELRPPNAIPAVSVYVAYPGKAAAGLPGDADHLSMLQRRIVGRGGVVVALVDDAAIAPVTPLRPARLGLCPPAALQDWVNGVPERSGCVAVVFDRAGTAVHSGRLSGALDDAVERVLDGRCDRTVEWTNTALALSLDAQLWSAGRGMQKTADQLLLWSPRDGLVHGLRYLAASEKALDAAAADAAWQSSTAALANEPRALAEFADLVLRGAARRAEIAPNVVTMLAGATALAPGDTAVQLAYLRALVARGRGRAVAAHAERVRPLAFATAGGALELAEILAHAEDAPTHRALCRAALARAEELGCAAPWLDAVRYEIARRVLEDTAAAEAQFTAAVASLGSRIAVNNRCWYLLTAHDQRGRGDLFATALADWLLREPEKMDSAEYDTAALAMFVAGRIEQAVACETAALRHGADRDYEQRLRRYEAAQKRSPR